MQCVGRKTNPPFSCVINFDCVAARIEPATFRITTKRLYPLGQPAITNLIAIWPVYHLAVLTYSTQTACLVLYRVAHSEPVFFEENIKNMFTNIHCTKKSEALFLNIFHGMP